MIDLESRLTGILAEKNLAHQVTLSNIVFAKYAGTPSPEANIGLSDYQLPWHEYAHLYEAHEKDALKGICYSTITPVKDCSGEELLFLHTKLPKKDEKGNIIGILCRAIEILNPQWKELNLLLKQKNPFNKTCYYVGRPNFEKLSKRQSDILFYLAHGKQTKIIAKIMNLSARTIEHHIDCIKEKLECKSKSELISFAISQGFVEMLPNTTVESLIKALAE